MAHVVAVFDPPLALTNGRIYTAQACGRQRDDGRWEAWLEFVPDDGSVVLRTERETTQRNLAEIEHWASTLTPVYLHGALERTLTPPPVAVEQVELPSVYEEPAPTRAQIAPIARLDTDRAEALLDPFFVYAAHGEDYLVRQLAALTPPLLRAIIVKHDFADPSSADLATLAAPGLIERIVGGVRGRLTS
jgi:hypothetical protein